MVDDDDVAGERRRTCERLGAGGAAVDGDDEAGAVFDQALDRRDVRPVAFEQAVGDVDARFQTVMLEEAPEQRRGGRPVDVVVAEERDSLALLYRVGETGGGRVHVAQRARIGHQRFQRRIEDRRHVVGGHPARGEHAPQQLRQTVALADGGRARLQVAREALAPG